MPRGGVLPLMMFWIEVEFEAGSRVPNLMTCSCQSGVRVVGIEEDLPSQGLLETLLLQRALLHLVWSWSCSEEESSEFRGVLLSRAFLLSCLTARPRTEQNTALTSSPKFLVFIFYIFQILVVKTEVNKADVQRILSV